MTNKKDAKFIVYYNGEGDVVDVEAVDGSGCKVTKLDKLTLTHLMDLHAGNNIDLKSTQLMHVHGSPGCWIIIGGIPICICCP